MASVDGHLPDAVTCVPIVLVVDDDIAGAAVVSAFRRGAAAVVLNTPIELALLSYACRRVVSGDPYREHQVLNALVRYRSREEIATALGVTKRTVKHHLDNAYRKLGVSTEKEAAIVALREGLAA